MRSIPGVRTCGLVPSQPKVFADMHDGDEKLVSLNTSSGTLDTDMVGRPDPNCQARRPPPAALRKVAG